MFCIFNVNITLKENTLLIYINFQKKLYIIVLSTINVSLFSYNQL